ncbi:MAG: macro domain-containing protein [Gemmatimonadota bacterium]|nr:macro domain-containing protein [Gemmatimonadota bacterium]
MPQAVVQQTTTSQVGIRIVRGDITELDVDAFVLYANPDLTLGSGFGTVISVRGGPDVQKELAGFGPVAVGEVVVTGAGDLRARHIIHAVGPRFQEADTLAKLRTTVRNVLRCAEERGIARLALPAMGAGYHGIPNDVCARVMLETIQDHLAGPTGLTEVVLCVLDTPQFTSFEGRLAALELSP